MEIIRLNLKALHGSTTIVLVVLKRLLSFLDKETSLW